MYTHVSYLILMDKIFNFEIIPHIFKWMVGVVLISNYDDQIVHELGWYSAVIEC